MRYIKIIIVLCLPLLMATTITAQDFEEVTIPLSNPNEKGSLEVHIKKGPIKVIGTPRKDILVRYTSMGKSNKHKSKKKSKNGLRRIEGASLNLSVEEHDNEVSIHSNSWNQGIRLEIEIPQEMDLELGTYNNGVVEVENVKGMLELTSYNGPISAHNISGSVIADTYNGEIIVTFDEITPDTPMAFSTYNGEIDLTFPKGTKATTKMKTRNGEVYTGFENMVIEKQKVKQEKGHSGATYKVKIGEWMIGKINGGGAEFTMKNYNGDLYIREKE